MLSGFRTKALQMLERQLALLDGRRPGGRGQSRPLAEHHEVEQGISHQPVAPVKAAGGLSGDEQILDVGFRVGVDLDAPVLIVEGWIDQHGILADVDAKPLE